MAVGKPVGAFLHSFVFSIWDNVVGPKVIKVWPSYVIESQLKKSIGDCEEVDEVGVEVNEDNQPFSKSGLENVIAKYLALHTLTGHLVTRESEIIDYETASDICLSVPALNFLAQSTTFYSLMVPNYECSRVYQDDPCMTSFSIVFNYEFEEMFWNLHPLLLHLIHHVTRRIKVGLSQDPYYHKKSLVLAWIAEIYSQLRETVDLSVQFPTHSPLGIKEIFSKSSLAWDTIITAMLSTGSCCVVGRNENTINRVVDLLLFFLPDADQTLCCRYASDCFCCGLHIQGLLEDPQGSRNINSAGILLNKFPLTLVDLSHKGRVKFSGYLHEHYRRKQRQLRQQEYNIIENHEPDVLFTTDGVFRTFGSSSRYVRWCLEQLDSHNVDHWPRIISSFHRALSFQADTLLKAFYDERQQKGESMTSLCSRLRKTLQITEPDFWLLAATAERMQPGFCLNITNYRF